MDAINLLKKDHEKVKKLLGELAESTSRATKRRTELLEQIAHELELHTTVEEEIFYPAFRDAGNSTEDEKLFFEAHEEHRAVKALVLPDLQKTETSSEKFGGRAKVLKDLIEHHAEEEEEEMFPKARKLFDKGELAALGEAMEKRKEELGL